MPLVTIAELMKQGGSSEEAEFLENPAIPSHFAIQDHVKLNKVNPRLWNGMNALAPDYQEKFGKPMGIISWSRDDEYQAKLRAGHDQEMAKWEAGGRSGPQPTPVAKPGFSKHRDGSAVDVDEETRKNLNSFNLELYGLHRPVKNDPMHIEAIQAKPQVAGTRYGDLINEASEQYGVPPGILEGMMKFESDGNAKAVSPKGARGLMQIMPGTAKDLAKEMGVKPEEILNDPRLNVLAGARYLKQQYDSYGRWDKALAAYNGGPGIIQDAKDIPKAVAGYVKNVMDWADKKTPVGAFARGLGQAAATGFGKIMADTSQHAYMHTPPNEIANVPPRQEMIDLYDPKLFENRPIESKTDLVAATLGGLLGSVPEMAQSLINMPPLTQIAGGATLPVQLGARALHGAGMFAGLEAGQPGVTLKQLGSAAGAGALMGAASPLPALARIPATFTAGAGHHMISHPDASAFETALSGATLAGMSWLGGKHKLAPRGVTPLAEARAGMAPKTKLPPNYLETRLAQLERDRLEIPPFMRGEGEMPSSAPWTRAAAAEAPGFQIHDVAPYVGGRRVAPDQPQFRVGPDGTVIPSGESALPAVPGQRPTGPPLTLQTPTGPMVVLPDGTVYPAGTRPGVQPMPTALPGAEAPVPAVIPPGGAPPRGLPFPLPPIRPASPWGPPTQPAVPGAQPPGVPMVPPEAPPRGAPFPILPPPQGPMGVTPGGTTYPPGIPPGTPPPVPAVRPQGPASGPPIPPLSWGQRPTLPGGSPPQLTGPSGPDFTMVTPGLPAVRGRATPTGDPLRLIQPDAFSDWYANPEGVLAKHYQINRMGSHLGDVIADELILPGFTETYGPTMDAELTSPSVISTGRSGRGRTVKTSKPGRALLETLPEERGGKKPGEALPPAQPTTPEPTGTTAGTPSITPEMKHISDQLTAVDLMLEHSQDPTSIEHRTLEAHRATLVEQFKALNDEANPVNPNPVRTPEEAAQALSERGKLPDMVKRFLEMPEDTLPEMTRKAYYLRQASALHPDNATALQDLAHQLDLKMEEASIKPPPSSAPVLETKVDSEGNVTEVVPPPPPGRWAPPTDLQKRSAKVRAGIMEEEGKAKGESKPIQWPSREEPKPKRLKKKDIPLSTPAGAEVPAVPTVVARRQVGDLTHEYALIPPAGEAPEWKLVDNIYRDGKMINSGTIKAGTFKEVRRAQNDDPGVRLAKQVHEPMDAPQVYRQREDLGNLALEETAGELNKMETEMGRPMTEEEKKQFLIEDDFIPGDSREFQDLPPSQQEMALKTEKLYDQMRSDLEAKRHRTWKEWWTQKKRNWTDFTAPMKDVLERAGPEGQKAIRSHQLSAGSTPKAERVYAQVNRDVWGGLDSKTSTLLDNVITSRMLISTSARRPDIKNPALRTEGGLETIGPEHHQAYIDALPADIRPVLMERSDRYFRHFRSLLDFMKGEDMLTPGGYEALSKPEVLYSPRWFIQHIAGEEAYQFRTGGRTVTVNGSGIRSLDEGSLKALELDAKKMMAEYTVQVYARAYRNRANRELLHIADNMPEAGVARRLNGDMQPKAGESVIHVVSNREGEVGRTVKMAIPGEMAEGWILADPQVSQGVAKFMQTISGTKVLKAMATGYNPVFGLANLPRDIAHVFFTTNEYSSFPLRFAFQMGRDMAKTMKDAWNQTGRFEDMMNEGGGMSFLTHQGKIKLWGHGKMKTLADMMGKFGEFTETWVRLSLRERNLENQKAEVSRNLALRERGQELPPGARTEVDPLEATWVARNYMDFYQGGRYAKFVDNFIPYFNASIVGTRGVARGFKSNPGLMLWKVANVGMIAAGLALHNELNNPNTMAQISDEVKNSNWIFTLGDEWSYKDDAGNERINYVAIPKDQFTRVVGSIFEEGAKQLIGKEVNGGRVTKAMKDFFPIVGSSLPPTAQAYFGYTGNMDYWRGQSIWKGKKVDPSQEFYTERMGRDATHPVMVEWGRLSGMSPVKTAHALSQVFTSSNPMVSTPVEISRMALTQPGAAEEKDRTLSETLTKLPVMSRFWKSTSPYAAYGSQISEYAMDVNTDNLKQLRAVDQLSEIYSQDKDPDALHNIHEYIMSQPKIDREGLHNRFKFNTQIADYPNRDWWLQTYSLPSEAKAKAFYDRYQGLGPEEQQDFVKKAMSLRGYGGDKFRYHLRNLFRGASEASGG